MKSNTLILLLLKTYKVDILLNFSFAHTHTTISKLDLKNNLYFMQAYAKEENVSLYSSNFTQRYFETRLIVK